MVLVVKGKTRALAAEVVLFLEDIRGHVVGLLHGGVAHVEQAMLDNCAINSIV